MDEEPVSVDLLRALAGGARPGPAAALSSVLFKKLMFNCTPFPQKGLYAWKCDLAPTLRNFYHQNEC